MAFVGSKSSFTPCQLLGQASGQTSSPTKSDSTWTDIPEMSLAIDMPDGAGALLPWCDVVLFFDPSLSPTLIAGETRWAIDGQEVTGSVRAFGYRTPSIVGLTPGDIYPAIVLPQLRLAQSGSFTLSAQWSVTSGTAVAHSTHRSIQAMSLSY